MSKKIIPTSDRIANYTDWWTISKYQTKDKKYYLHHEMILRKIIHNVLLKDKIFTSEIVIKILPEYTIACLKYYPNRKYWRIRKYWNRSKPNYDSIHRSLYLIKQIYYTLYSKQLYFKTGKLKSYTLNARTLSLYLKSQLSSTLKDRRSTIKNYKLVLKKTITNFLKFS